MSKIRKSKLSALGQSPKAWTPSDSLERANANCPKLDNFPEGFSALTAGKLTVPPTVAFRGMAGTCRHWQVLAELVGVSTASEEWEMHLCETRCSLALEPLSKDWLADGNPCPEEPFSSFVTNSET